MKNLLLFLVLIYSCILRSQNFSNLIENGKYSKVWKKCQKGLKKSPDDVELLYFSSVVASSSLSGNLYSPQTAYSYYLNAQLKYSNISNEKELNKYDRIPINYTSFRVLSDSIYVGALNQANKINTEEVYIDLLSFYKEITDKYKSIAIGERNRLAFEKASRENTVESFQKFIDKYPDAIEISKAKKERNKLAFQNAIELNSIEAYKSFINTYPEAIEVSEALQKIHSIAYQEAMSINTIEAYEKFIVDYPKANQVITATEKIHELAFEKAKRFNNSAGYRDFTIKYPKSKQFNEAFSLFELKEFEENTVPGSWESYRDFYENFNSNYSEIALDSILELSYAKKNPKSLLYCIEKLDDNSDLIVDYYNLISKDGELSTLNFFKNNFPSYISKIENFYEDYETAELASQLGLTIDNPPLSFNTEMEKRLKREGAKSGAITISLMWDNYNDIDLHCIDPRGEVIYFGHRQSRSGGELDVDMNAGGPVSNEPVENIYWENKKAIKGNYQVYVNHYANHGCYECYDPTNYTVVVRYNNIVKEFKGKISSGDPIRLIHEFNFSNKNFGEFELDARTKENLQNYIFKAGDKELSFVALQKLISKDVESKKWSVASAEIEKFQNVFENNLKYINLVKLLKDNSQNSIVMRDVSPVNSIEGEEYSPVISGDSKSLYFCGYNRSDSIGGEDVYVSKFRNNSWSTPLNVLGLSKANSNDALMAVSTDESKAILFHNGKLAYSEKSSIGWTDLIYFPDDINNCIWNGDAMVSSNGNSILFASVRENDGFGTGFFHNDFYHATQGYFSDIYVSIQSENGWSQPINLGPKINTNYIERSPFLHPDMKTLYFSSDGHGGFGKLDVFMSTRLADSCWDCWSDPINLGREINSIHDDWGYKISTDGKLAYFSKKMSQSSSDDIFNFTLPANLRPDIVARIEGELKNARNEPISTTIRWEDLESNKVIGISKSDPQDGSYFIVLPMGKNYGYFIEDSTYFPLSQNLDLRNSLEAIEVKKDIMALSFDEMIEQRIAVPMNNLFFNAMKSDLLPSSIPELTRIAKIIKQKNLSIELGGHTDNVGTESMNLKLSEDRAKSVKSFLISQGVNPNSIKAVGFGFSQPKVSNDSEEGKALNRRVEILLIKN